MDVYAFNKRLYLLYKVNLSILQQQGRYLTHFRKQSSVEKMEVNYIPSHGNCWNIAVGITTSLICCKRWKKLCWITAQTTSGPLKIRAMKHHEVGYVENIVICIQNPKNYKSRTISTAARPPDSGPIGSGHSDNDNDKASIDIEDVGAKASSMGTMMPSRRLKIQLKRLLNRYHKSQQDTGQP